MKKKILIIFMNDFCLICIDDFKNKIKISCGHEFCYLCIKGVKLLKYDSKCPICRSDISDLDNIKLETKDEIDLDYIWLYSGKHNGWWIFDKESTIRIEEMYQKYLS